MPSLGPPTPTLVDVLSHLDGVLVPGNFKDYGPNGLQVEGRPQVRRLVTGVTASLAFIEAAVKQQADAILVHHGLFWRGQDGCVKGWMKQRLALLLAHDISLLAYHLPLDAHPQLGNNAQLARVLELEPQDGPAGRFGEQSLGFMGVPAHGAERSLDGWANWVAQRLGRPVVQVGHCPHPIRRVAWCTGGAQSYLEAAVAAGADLFITGELSEPQTHLAREMGVGYLACGHHATERYGVQALGAHVAAHWGIQHTFIEIDNPA